jgi:predicted glycogen debranching enzyme
MSPPIRRIPWPPVDPDDPDAMASLEWLVTNGIGGYASGTVSGVVTRRYHGLLIAALPSPLGRIVMLSHLSEQLRLENGRHYDIGGRESTGGTPDARGAGYLTEFRLEAGLPVWRYEVDGLSVEKRLFLPHGQNTVQISYALQGADRAELMLRPSVNFRPQEAPVSEPLARPYEFRTVDGWYEISLADTGLPPLRFKLYARDAGFILKGQRTDNVLYPIEESRGYQARGDLWSPGYFCFTLSSEQPATLLGSTESVKNAAMLEPAAALEAEQSRRHRLLAQTQGVPTDGTIGELVLAADQFVITPAARWDEAVQAQAAGDEVRTIIAGYHWFTDWGRDTMISLEGLTLVTGRHVEAGYILRTFANHVRNGLIPNLFPEGEREGLYHTADATLWFFHAVDRYLAYSDDRVTFRMLYPILKDIVRWHVAGTLFGIHADPGDGLLAQGAPGYQLTWMDAKVDGWVVTPRRGKAVEINALWYNALRLMERWADEQSDADSAEYHQLAERVFRSFNERFWYDAGGYLYDVVDGENPAGGAPGDRWSDTKCRPNQIFAVALPHPVLDSGRWGAVVNTVRERLLTPVGLRSLAPGDPDYKPRYFGDLRARDAAYHQGTVWAWLAGPFIDAWLRVYPEDLGGAWQAIHGFVTHLDRACVGSISEVFDAEAPYIARGCIAQAWSVAEVLRVLVKLERYAAGLYSSGQTARLRPGDPVSLRAPSAS